MVMTGKPECLSPDELQFIMNSLSAISEVLHDLNERTAVLSDASGPGDSRPGPRAAQPGRSTGRARPARGKAAS